MVSSQYVATAQRVGIIVAVLLVAFSVQAGSGTAQSGTFTVDTRNGNQPVVQDVVSKYCDQKRHVYFLSGAPLIGSFLVDFKVDFDWNDKEPGTIRLG